MPGVDEFYTRSDILAMDFVKGEPIESLASASQATRDRAVGLLLELLFRELFEFRLVQIDPNFAKFLFNAGTGRPPLGRHGRARVPGRCLSGQLGLDDREHRNGTALESRSHHTAGSDTGLSAPRGSYRCRGAESRYVTWTARQ